MIQGIKSVFVGLTLENEDEPTSALGYGLSLAHQAGAYATVYAASLRLVLANTHVRAVARVAASENYRRRKLSDLVAARARDDALAAGVDYTVEMCQLNFPAL